MSRPRKTSALAACFAVALAACGDEAAPPSDPLPPQPATSPVPETTGADGGVSLADIAGSWEASYDAKKGRVGMPKGVDDPGRAADDGKVATGAGTVKITIGPEGDVTGKSQGALGSASVRGKIDGKMLRASFVPDDMLAPQAMTGVLVGIVKGDRIEAELRVAGPDALLVRQANFDLEKK